MKERLPYLCDCHANHAKNTYTWITYFSRIQYVLFLSEEETYNHARPVKHYLECAFIQPERDANDVRSKTVNIKSIAHLPASRIDYSITVPLITLSSTSSRKKGSEVAVPVTVGLMNVLSVAMIFGRSIATTILGIGELQFVKTFLSRLEDTHKV